MHNDSELTDYNQIADLYVAIKTHPWRRLVEEYSFHKLIGDVSGQRVIDLACGQGFHTRKFRQGGAADVLGVDKSEAMIELARIKEAAAPLGVRYEVEDVCTIGPAEQFDLAASAWLLVYARNLAELDKFCAGVARRVAPGGRFVTFTTNVDMYHFPEPPRYQQYGFTVELEPEAREGALIHLIFPTPQGDCLVDNYYLPKESYRSALEKAGFTDVRFVPVELAPEAEVDAAYWRYFLERPFAFMIEAWKAE